MLKRNRRNEWLSEMLDLHKALDDTIRNMISYKMNAGPWNDRDVDDGWQVLRGIIAVKEKKLCPKPIIHSVLTKKGLRKIGGAKTLKLGLFDESNICTCKLNPCVCWHNEK